MLDGFFLLSGVPGPCVAIDWKTVSHLFFLINPVNASMKEIIRVCGSENCMHLGLLLLLGDFLEVISQNFFTVLSFPEEVLKQNQHRCRSGPLPKRKKIPLTR